MAPWPNNWLKMHAVKRLHACNTKTACEYAHLQVWVWDACELHKSFNCNSFNVCIETIGFTIIRKIVDEHELATALCWVSYELEMRVSRLRRLTCTASAFLKTVSSDCMSWLEIWICWFWNGIFEEKKFVKRFPNHNH